MANGSRTGLLTVFRELLGRLVPRKAAARIAARVDLLYRQGAGAYREERHSEAALCAEHALALDPTLAAIHFLLGSARLELREFEAAESAFEACLALAPEYPMVLHAAVRRALARARADLARGRMPRIEAAEPADRRSVSVVICSITPERFDRVCANYRVLLDGVPHEIIGVHDARSLCEGYNKGIRRARGEILVFSHDDIEIATPDFAAKLLNRLSRYDLIGIAGTTRLIGGNWIDAGWPHLHGQVGSEISKPGSLIVTIYQLRGAATANVQAIDGVFLAARREVVERLAFDETTFDGWHLYDLDFSFSAHLAGFRTAVCHDVCLIHNSIGDYGDCWRHYVQRFEEKHRGRLQQGGQAQERCWIELDSPAEWLLMTEEMASQAGRSPWPDIRT